MLAAVAVELPEKPAAHLHLHLHLPLDTHIPPVGSVLLAAAAGEAAATAVVAVGVGTAEVDMDTDNPRARPDPSAGGGDTANNSARLAVPSMGVDLAAVTDLWLQVEVAYEIAAETKVHPGQEGVDLAVESVRSDIHYNSFVELAVLVVSVVVVVMAAVGEEFLLPFYRMTGVVCSSFDMWWWMMVEVPGFASSILPHRRREVGRGRGWVGVELVEGDHLCCGGCRFVGVALRASCRSIVLRWRALHGDRIAPHIYSWYHQMSLPAWVEGHLCSHRAPESEAL